MIQDFANYCTYTLLRLDPASRLGESVNYFIYDSVKILILLFLMISVVGFLRTYLSPAKVRAALSKRSGLVGHFLAALFGAITPFCSCSSIPIFLSFLRAGVPLGISFSFLITSPIINEYLVVLMWGFFGWKITVAYVISGLLMGTLGGFILGKMNLDKYLEKDFAHHKLSLKKELIFRKVKQRIWFGIKEATTIFKSIWIWILIGVAVGAAIHNFVPRELITKAIEITGPFAVPIVTILGVPTYGSCVAIVPIAVALFQKGFPLGTAIAFLLSVAALSLPEAIMLRRAMKLKLILLFFGIVAAAIMITGYLFNFLEPILV